MRYAAIVLVNAAKDAKPLELTATVARDRPTRVLLLDADDKPVVGAVAHLFQAWGPFDVERRLRGASFSLAGLQPNRVQSIAFAHADRQLIGFLQVRGDGEAAATVVMQRWGSVIGRFVDADGKPLDFSLAEGEGPVVLNNDPLGSKFYRTHVAADGRFQIDGLVPGQSYTCLRVYRRVALGWSARVFERLSLQRGEVRDVGDIRVTPLAD